VGCLLLDQPHPRWTTVLPSRPGPTLPRSCTLMTYTLPPAMSWASTPAVESSMRANRRRDTGPEMAVRSRLHRMGFRYRVDARPIPSVARRADIVFRPQRVAVFVDGCFWHQCPTHGSMPARNQDYWKPKLDRNFERDRQTDEFLASIGWTVLRIWEHEDPDVAVGRIALIVRQRSRTT